MRRRFRPIVGSVVGRRGVCSPKGPRTRRYLIRLGGWDISGTPGPILKAAWRLSLTSEKLLPFSNRPQNGRSFGKRLHPEAEWRLKPFRCSTSEWKQQGHAYRISSPPPC